MLILVGPSASGKTEAVKELVKKYNMEKLVTYTSRPMRNGEISGIDYHFISREEFEKRIKDNFFLEFVLYNNNYYGTSFSDITDNKVVILEPTGLKEYLKKLREKIKVVYLSCPKEILFKRMVARGDQPDSIKKRIEGDDLVFTKELETIADYTIDSSKMSLEEMTDEIYRIYKK